MQPSDDEQSGATPTPEQPAGAGASCPGCVTCPACGGDLPGAPLERCPECGLEDASSQPTAQRIQNQRYARYKRRAVQVAAVLFLLLLPLDNLGRFGAPPQFLCALGVGVCALVWGECDAAIAGGRPSQLIRGLLLLLPAAGLPLYVIGRRRWGALLKLVGLAVIMTVASELLAASIFRALHGSWGTPGTADFWTLRR